MWCRVDFRWLAEGWALDHSTISIFRQQFADLLNRINTQFGLLAYQMGVTTLTQFGFDGTRLRASSSRSRIVDVAKLDEIENELQKTFAELEQQVAAAEAQDEEQLGDASLHRVEKKLAKTENRPRPALIKVVDRRADDRSPLHHPAGDVDKLDR